MQETPDQVVQLVLQGRQYGLPLDQVERIIPIAALRPVPQAQPHWLGLLDLHQTSVPVLDLPGLLGLHPRKPFTVDAAIIIVRVPGAQTGFLVDDVIGVTRVARGAWQRRSGLSAGGDDCIAVTHTRDGLLMLLDAQQLLAGEPIGSG